MTKAKSRQKHTGGKTRWNIWKFPVTLRNRFIAEAKLSGNSVGDHLEYVLLKHFRQMKDQNDIL